MEKATTVVVFTVEDSAVAARAVAGALFDQLHIEELETELLDSGDEVTKIRMSAPYRGGAGALARLAGCGMGGVVLGILVWQEGGEYVLLIMAVGAIALGSLAYWLSRRKRQAKVTLIDPDLFKVPNFRIGASQMVMQQITLGGAMIAVPLYLQVTLEYDAMEAGLSLAPLSLTMFAVSLLAGKKAGDRRPASIIRVGFGLTLVGMLLIVPIIPRGESGWALLAPLLIAGSGLGLLVSQLNNYILAPIAEERVSEAAGVNSAGQSFGLSFGLAVAGGLLLAALSLTFVNMTESSDVIPQAQQERIADVLEDHAQLVSTTQLEESLADEPSEVRDEIVRINTEAGTTALQVAMIVPILACLLGFLNSFRLMRLPDHEPSAAIEGMLGG
jgi:hypothetical protein